MEKDANDKFKDSDIKLPDPFLERCKAKKRHYPKDSFLYEQGESSKRCATDSLRKCMQVGSNHAFYDPFEDYVKKTENYPPSDSVTRKKTSRTVSS